MKKLLICAVVVLTLILSVCAVSAMDISVIIDNDKIEFDVPPIEVNGRTLVPLRKIFETLGATVDYNNTTAQITATKDDKVIKLTVDDNKLDVNGTVTTLDVPATVVKGRTLVPARAVSEALECIVGWDEETFTVTITSKEKAAQNTVDPTGQYLATSKPSIPSADISIKSSTLAIAEGEAVENKTNTSVAYQKNEKIYTWEHKSTDVFHFTATIKHPELDADTKIPLEIRLSPAVDRKFYHTITRDVTLLKGQTETKVSFNIDFNSENFYNTFLKYAEDPVRVCYTVCYDSKNLAEIFQQLDYGYAREREYISTITYKNAEMKAYNSVGGEIQAGPTFKKYNNLDSIKLSLRLNASQVPQYYTYPYRISIYKYGTTKSQKTLIDEKVVDFVNYKENADGQGEHTISVTYDKNFCNNLIGNHLCVITLLGEEIESYEFSVERP